MTISPMAAPMAAPASIDSSGAPTRGSASTEFEALVQQHLGQQSSAEEGSDRLPAEEAAAMLEAALLAGMLAAPRAGDGGTASEDGGPAVAMVTSGGAAPGAVLPGVPLTGEAVTVVGADGTGDETGAAVATGGEPVVVAPATASGVQADARIDAADVSRTSDAGAGRVAEGAAGAVDADASDPGSAMSSTLPSAATTDAAATSGLGTAGVAGTTDSSVAATSGPGPAGISGVGGSATATAGGGTTAEPVAVRGNPVADQVFGHVTRLVSRGDGTHRLMLRLHPADLGEVKVVLTVRDNNVDVTLSAGPAAREALRDGSPQLRSLLEIAGATTGQVVIRDHAGAATFSSTSDRALQNGDPQGTSGRDGSGPADTRADTGGSRSSRGGDRGLAAGPQSGGSTDARSITGPRAPGAAAQIPTRLDLNL